jgi:hypothetical protein
MDSQHTSRWFPLTLSAVFVGVAFIVNTTATQSPQNANSAAKTADGLTVVTFTLDPGKITVSLPDEMRAGDTISGTVVPEPKGQTKEERDKNLSQLEGYVIALTPVVPARRGAMISQVTFVIDKSHPILTPITFTAPAKLDLGLYMMPNENAPLGTSGKGGALQCINESCSPISQLVFDVPRHPSGAVITPDPTITPTFIVPPLGQTGRPIVITGPFDGNSSNTTINWTAIRTSVQDFEKNTENVSGGFGLIAESPRKAIVTAPSTVTGPIQIQVNENGAQTTGNYRNVGVNLTAPKTSLLKGERTTLKVEVSGLQGITEPVPLTLESRGVITMEGGTYQPLIIQPSQVGADGRYSTTRGITGVQTGAWGATATVVTQRFDVCLQDDTAPARQVLWNTFTGDYIFSCPGCPSASQTGNATTSSGKGTVTMKGCIITLEHNAPDRRVMGTIDQCTKTGTAIIENRPTKMKFTITDRNTTDNTCTCGPRCK